ncbi:MAG: response regulator [Devosiaceae bacterium]|nr:response regulator [Devosiaceae bacterium]
MKPDVLIVEDEPAILTSLEFILHHAGWATACVTDGEAAMQYIQLTRPRAVVLDLMLPKKNGFEVLKALRADPRTHDLPILILTAKGQQQDKLTAMELGASGFITKPYANSDVVDAVNELIGTPPLSKKTNIELS